MSISKRVKRKKKSSGLPSWAENAFAEIKDWCQGRLWWPRLLMLFLFAHILVSHIREPLYSDLFKGLNLGIHELGHMVFAPFGELMGVAGGSLFQCLVPVLSTIMFYRQRDYFAIAVCFGWLSTNLFDVAVYADDARRLELPLVTPFKGGETIHDWNFLLDKLDLMPYDHMIATDLRIAAVLSMLICIGTGFCLVYQMMKSPKKTKLEDVESA